MNQSSEEERIRALFRQLKRADERLAPSFASVWQSSVSQAPLSQIRKANQRRFTFRLAAALIAIILSVASAFVFFKQRSKPPVQTETAGPIESVPARNDTAAAPVKLPEKISPKRARMTRPARPRQPVVAITEWRSPTNFLLVSPGDEWLKSVPRLDESVVRIEPMVPEE